MDANFYLVRPQRGVDSCSPAPVESPQRAETGTTITVTRGIIAPVLVTKEVRDGAFGASQDEQKVKFAVDQDVIYQGYVIAKPADLAEGHYDTRTNQTKRQFETTAS